MESHYNLGCSENGVISLRTRGTRLRRPGLKTAVIHVLFAWPGTGGAPTAPGWGILPKPIHSSSNGWEQMSFGDSILVPTLLGASWAFAGRGRKQ